VDEEMAELLRLLQDEGESAAPAVGTALTKPTDVHRPTRQPAALIESEGGIGFDPEFAPFGARALGFLVDALVLAFLLAPGIVLMTSGGVARTVLGLAVAVFGFSLGTLLYARMVSRRAQSFGNLVTKTKVVDARHGRRVGAAEAGLRYVLRFTVSLVLFAGFLVAFGDSQRRTFHDKVAGTVVIGRPRESWSIEDEMKPGGTS
jgi:uncharacterized RDD family membrane protein YckC